VEPWQRAEVPGPVKAQLLTKPEVVSALLKRAKRPLLVVGTGVLGEEGGRALDYVIRIARAGKIPVVATAHTAVELKRRGFQPAARMAAVEICSRLTDPGWSLQGDGQPHDLVLILGLGPYYMEWLMESGLKSFALHLRTISLNRFYQPHCSWSFPNLSEEEWYKNLERIAEELER